MWRGVLAVALLCGALIAAEPLKRAEMSAVPFSLGSRYGRSPERMMSPRNGRFVMGLRYGKRGAGGGRRPPWHACDCRSSASDTGDPRTYYERRSGDSQRAPEQD